MTDPAPEPDCLPERCHLQWALLVSPADLADAIARKVAPYVNVQSSITVDRLIAETVARYAYQSWRPGEGK